MGSGPAYPDPSTETFFESVRKVIFTSLNPEKNTQKKTRQQHRNGTNTEVTSLNFKTITCCNN